MNESCPIMTHSYVSTHMSESRLTHERVMSCVCVCVCGVCVCVCVVCVCVCVCVCVYVSCRRFWRITSGCTCRKSARKSSICCARPTKCRKGAFPGLVFGFQFSVSTSGLVFGVFLWVSSICCARRMKCTKMCVSGFRFWIQRLGYRLRVFRFCRIISLFCKRALCKRRYSAKETYHLKEPTEFRFCCCAWYGGECG